MAVNTSNLALGPGTLYVADFGATEPADSAINTTPSSAVYTDVGGTLGGMTMSVTQEYATLEVDQIIETPERRATKREVSFKTRLAEVSFANLVIALNSGTVTTSASYSTYEPSDVNSGTFSEYKSILFDGYGPAGLRRRVIVRKVLSTDALEIAASKTEQQAYPVTFMSHYVSSVIPSYKIIQAAS